MWEILVRTINNLRLHKMPCSSSYEQMASTTLESTSAPANTSFLFYLSARIVTLELQKALPSLTTSLPRSRKRGWELSFPLKLNQKQDWIKTDTRAGVHKPKTNTYSTLLNHQEQIKFHHLSHDPWTVIPTWIKASKLMPILLHCLSLLVYVYLGTRYQYL